MKWLQRDLALWRTTPTVAHPPPGRQMFRYVFLRDFPFTTKNHLSTSLPLNSSKYEFQSGATRQDAREVERECRRCWEQWKSGEAARAAGQWGGGRFALCRWKTTWGKNPAREIYVANIELFSFVVYYIQGGFFDCSALKMTKCQPLKEISELFLPKND